jgi:hypothetical protein
MDTIETLLHSLGNADFRELENYLGGRTPVKDRKDKELFAILGLDPPLPSDDAIRKLYRIPKKSRIPENKRNSYHQWRSILTGRIEDFLVRQIGLEDLAPHIFKQILIARYLLMKGLYEGGFRYLSKAEEGAQKLKRYDLLHRIYSMQIEYAWTQPKLDLTALLTLWKNNLEQEQKESRINTALGVIKKRLKEIHREGQNLNTETLVKETIRDYDIDIGSPQGGYTRYRIAMIILVLMQEKREYTESHAYLQKVYESMESDDQLNGKNDRLKTLMLSQLFQTALLSRQYDYAEKHYQLLRKQAPDLDESPLYQFWGHMITPIFLACTGRLKEALVHIHEVENSKIWKMNSDNDDCFAALHSNLVFLHYMNKDLAGVQKYLARMMNREKTVIQHHGYAAIVTLHLFDCMINIDKKEYEYVLTKSRAMRKRFHKFLMSPENASYRDYLTLLLKLCSNKDWTQSSTYRTKALEFIQHARPVQGGGPYDLITFQSYILSKIESQSYYSAFLGLVNPGSR